MKKILYFLLIFSLIASVVHFSPRAQTTALIMGTEYKLSKDPFSLTEGIHRITGESFENDWKSEDVFWIFVYSEKHPNAISEKGYIMRMFLAGTYIHLKYDESKNEWVQR